MVTPGIPRGGSMKKKLTLSKETLRTLDEKDLSQIVGAASGNNVPPGNGCPNTKVPNPQGCKGK
jgi:hypothetical protein